MSTFTIAGLQLNIDFANELITEALKSFESKPENNLSSPLNCSQIRISLSDVKAQNSHISASSESDLSVFPAKADYMNVRVTPFGYVFLYSESSTLAKCDVNVDAREAVITPKHGYSADLAEDTETLKTDLFFAIRDVFFLFALREGRVPVHSSSVIYNDKAYLFSAPSGTGKTTHTNFWVEKYGVEILNGDIAVLAFENDEPVAYGLPWCGTSGKYANKRVPLGGVIFLYRADINRIRPLSPLEGITSLFARTLSTSFERADVEQNLATVSDLAPHIAFLRLDCTNSPEAAETVKQYIDNIKQASHRL